MCFKSKCVFSADKSSSDSPDRAATPIGDVDSSTVKPAGESPAAVDGVFPEPITADAIENHFAAIAAESDASANEQVNDVAGNVHRPSSFPAPLAAHAQDREEGPDSSEGKKCRRWRFVTGYLMNEKC